MVSRREFFKLAGATSAAMMVARMRWAGVLAQSLFPGLSDPALQPKFAHLVPDALAPSFKYVPYNGKKKYQVGVGPSLQATGLVGTDGLPVMTPILGYGQDGTYTWPGKTFEVESGTATKVTWTNDLSGIDHPLPVDTSLHWAYSLPGYEQYSIPNDGIPIVPHLHGGHTKYKFDGNPEFFFSPGFSVLGPRWEAEEFKYKNDQPAGNLWYHDHALGITRLNVYAGMAGFYFVRDDIDTGKVDNPLGLPAWPYEKAYAIQDRMFRDTGELFYPAFPDEPFYDDFITGEGALLPPDIFPGGGPTALAEFFGDHMVVNGVIWPKEEVEPRNYRLHLLNGTDSRFMVVRFRPVPAGATDLSAAGDPLPFYVIGSDQGLASAATQTELLISEPGSRYDIVVDFSQVPFGTRIIMENLGGDAPYGGDHGDALDPADFFPNRQTDRIMAFDVNMSLDTAVPDVFDPNAIAGFSYTPNINAVDRVRKVALFEGLDEFGRLQPLLGTAELATDRKGKPINWPDTAPYINAGLVGQMQGSIAWHSPTTENPKKNQTEIWEIYNATGDAHPVHLHLVHFDVIDRQEFTADVINQPVVQHNGLQGIGFRLENIVLGAMVPTPPGYVENAPKDMVTALPGQVTRIKMTFDKKGRYVWHCHILSHEDHEMMRVLHVGKEA